MIRQGSVIGVVGTLLCACLTASQVSAQGDEGDSTLALPSGLALLSAEQRYGVEAIQKDPLAPSDEALLRLKAEGWFIGSALTTQSLALRPGAPEPEWRARFGAGVRRGPASFTLNIRHSDDLPLADQLGLALTARYQF
ncbi:hypothetical protein [Ferrimonas gelatinilytica]|uniref:Uncharacterized protein n=1 Tax=Ferrimonas gelatinilytica TaxID=1255257 RepID=A0ABP9S996_9GAMM